MDIWIVSILKNIFKQDILLLMPWHTARVLLWAAFLEVGETIKFNRRWRIALPKRGPACHPRRRQLGECSSLAPLPARGAIDHFYLCWSEVHLWCTREHLLTGLLAFFREWPFRVLFNIFQCIVKSFCICREKTISPQLRCGPTTHKMPFVRGFPWRDGSVLELERGGGGKYCDCAKCHRTVHFNPFHSMLSVLWISPR